MNQNALQLLIYQNQGYKPHGGKEYGKQSLGSQTSRMNYPTMLELPSAQAQNQMGQRVDPRFGAYQDWQNHQNGDLRHQNKHPDQLRYSETSSSCCEGDCCGPSGRWNHNDFLLFCCLFECCCDVCTRFL